MKYTLAAAGKLFSDCTDPFFRCKRKKTTTIWHSTVCRPLRLCSGFQRFCAAKYCCKQKMAIFNLQYFFHLDHIFLWIWINWITQFSELVLTWFRRIIIHLVFIYTIQKHIRIQLTYILDKNLKHPPLTWICYMFYFVLLIQHCKNAKLFFFNLFIFINILLTVKD